MAADLEYEDPDNVPSVTARVSLSVTHTFVCLKNLCKNKK